jgi:Tol biopolymer transport system component
LAFAGYDSKEWAIYLVDNKQGIPEKVMGISHPRNFTWNRNSGKIVFITLESALMEFDLKSGLGKVLLEAGARDHFTQPRYSQDQKRLFAVRLPDGNSRQTQLIEILDGGTYEAVVRKRTAQFEPFMLEDRYLFYTTAICVDDCGRMIWELWRRDMLTGDQIQLTLGNQVSRQPVLKEKEWIYFSSNRDGNYHIWRTRADPNATAEQLTTGEVHDSDIAFDAKGDMYFIRRTNDAVRLMKRTDDVLSEIKLPDAIIDIRNMEIRP